MALKIFSFRLDEALIARVDERVSKRGPFVRAAIEAALDGVDHLAAQVAVAGAEPNEVIADLPMKKVPGGKRVSKPKVKLPEVSFKRHPDAQAIWDAIAEKGLTERQLGVDLGWSEMRVSRAVQRLGNDVLYRSGLVMRAVYAT